MVQPDNEGKNTRINPYEDILLFTGKKRSGKTHAAKQYVYPVKRLLIWDYNWEHTNGQIVHNLGDIKTYFLQFRKEWKIIYQPVKKGQESFDALCDYLVAHVRYCMLYVEEVQLVANGHYIGDSFKQIIDVGRHQLKIGLCCTSRRPHRIPVDIPENSDYIFAFKQQRPEDWDYMEDFLDPEVVEQLKTKPKYWYILFDGEEGETKLKAPIKAQDKAIMEIPNVSQSLNSKLTDMFSNQGDL